MIHLRARRRLPDLLGGALDLGTEAAVRAHLARCGRCQRVLAEFEACDRLLAQLPLGLVPLRATRKTAPRLARLSRWAASPAPPAPLQWPQVGATALAAAATAALLILAATGGPGRGPDLRQGHAPTLVALTPDIGVVPGERWR